MFYGRGPGRFPPSFLVAFTATGLAVLVLLAWPAQAEGAALLPGAAAPVPAEGGGYRLALIYLGLAGCYLVVFGSIALLIRRDAVRHDRSGWLWALLFLWQPFVVGLLYLVVRRRPRHRPTPIDAG